MTRPGVSVVVPFLGTADDGAAALAALGRLRLGDDDELIVADNTAGGTLSGRSDGGVRVVGAPGRRSAFHARNVGAAGASGTWLLFIDADCVPEPDLLARLWEPEPSPRPAWSRARRAAPRRRGVPRPLVAVPAGPIASHQLTLGPRQPGRRANLLVRRTRWRPSAVSARCARMPTSSSAGASRSAAWRSSTARTRSSPTATPRMSSPSSARRPATEPGGAGALVLGPGARSRRWSARSRGPPPVRSPGRSRCGSSRGVQRLVDGLVAAATWVRLPGRRQPRP